MNNAKQTPATKKGGQKILDFLYDEELKLNTEAQKTYSMYVKHHNNKDLAEMYLELHNTSADRLQEIRYILKEISKIIKE